MPVGQIDAYGQQLPSDGLGKRLNVLRSLASVGFHVDRHGSTQLGSWVARQGKAVFVAVSWGLGMRRIAPVQFARRKGFPQEEGIA